MYTSCSHNVLQVWVSPSAQKSVYLAYDVFPLKEIDQADQVHRESEGEIYPAGPAGCGGARETQTHQEQNQETAETASERQGEGEMTDTADSFVLDVDLQHSGWANS